MENGKKEEKMTTQKVVSMGRERFSKNEKLPSKKLRISEFARIGQECGIFERKS